MNEEELRNEITNLCNQLLEESLPFANAEPVSHLSKATIQFNGGILGGIQEYREGKRLEKLINAKISGQWSFFTFAFHIIEEAETIAEKGHQLQEFLPKDSDDYYGVARHIITTIEQATSNWLHYSPDMAAAGIKIEDQDNVSLGISVDSLTREAFLKMDMPEEIKEAIKPKEQKNNSGCMGVLLLFVIPASIFGFMCL